MEDFIKNLTNLRNLTPVVKPNHRGKAKSEASSFASKSGIYNRATKEYKPEESVGFNINFKDDNGRRRAGILVVDRESANKWAKGETDSLDIYGAELDNGTSLAFNGVMDLMHKYDSNTNNFHITDREDFNAGDNYSDMDDYNALRSLREYMANNYPSRVVRVDRTKSQLPQLQPTFYSRLRDTYKK